MAEDRRAPFYLKKGLFYYTLVLAILLGSALLVSVFYSGLYPAVGFLFFPFIALSWLAIIFSINHKEYDSFGSFIKRCHKPLMIFTILFCLAAFCNFFISGIIMEGGVTDVRDGMYLLVSHGAVIRELARAEFLRLRGVEARMTIGFMLIFVLVPLTYFSARVPKTAHKRDS